MGALPPNADGLRDAILEFELSHFREVARPGIDLGPLKTTQAIQAKAFHGKTPHHRAVDHGAPQNGIGQTAGAGEITHESAAEAVACPSGIVHFLKEQRGH